MTHTYPGLDTILADSGNHSILQPFHIGPCAQLQAPQINNWVAHQLHNMAVILCTRKCFANNSIYDSTRAAYHGSAGQGTCKLSMDTHAGVMHNQGFMRKVSCSKQSMSEGMSLFVRAFTWHVDTAFTPVLDHGRLSRLLGAPLVHLQPQPSPAPVC